MFTVSPNPKIASPIPTIKNIIDTFEDNDTAIEDARAIKSSLVQKGGSINVSHIIDS